MKLKTIKDMIKNYKYYLQYIIVLLFVTSFVLSCIVFRCWDGWEQLSYIGTFFTGIGIIMTAFQLIFQERKDTKEQVELALDFSGKLQELELSFTNDDLDENAYINNVKKAVILLNKLELLHEKRLVDFKEVHALSGNSILKLLGISIKALLKYRSTSKGIAMNFSDSFIFRYKDHLLKIYELLSKYNKEASLFETEIKAFKMAKPSQDAPIHLLKK
jgi:hypothetical protein